MAMASLVSASCVFTLTTIPAHGVAVPAALAAQKDGVTILPPMESATASMTETVTRNNQSEKTTQICVV